MASTEEHKDSSTQEVLEPIKIPDEVILVASSAVLGGVCGVMYGQWSPTVSLARAAANGSVGFGALVSTFVGVRNGLIRAQDREQSPYLSSSVSGAITGLLLSVLIGMKARTARVAMGAMGGLTATAGEYGNQYLQELRARRAAEEEIVRRYGALPELPQEETRFQRGLDSTLRLLSLQKLGDDPYKNELQARLNQVLADLDEIDEMEGKKPLGRY
eukprot:Clim_evm12s219 gene=Clim_evmTU12s219